MPNVDELIRIVSRGKFWSKLDQTSAFYQIRMFEEDIPLTAVKTPRGLKERVAMPMELKGAPAMKQERLEKVLHEFLHDFCVVYLDDIMQFSQTMDEHETHLRIIFEKLRQEKSIYLLRRQNYLENK